jgi:hypothetical protein
MAGLRQNRKQPSAEVGFRSAPQGAIRGAGIRPLLLSRSRRYRNGSQVVPAVALFGIVLDRSSSPASLQA